MKPTIPPDVAAYLVRAAIEIAQEQSYTPKSRDDLKLWHDSNVQLIGERALSLMDNLRCKLLDKPEIMDQVKEALSLSVYNSIRKTPTASAWNPRYVAYARSHGLSPDEMIKRDGGKMVNFLCWRGN